MSDMGRCLAEQAAGMSDMGRCLDGQAAGMSTHGWVPGRTGGGNVETWAGA
ncbi:uncharacterized protein SOCE26_083000 [Sorangium cellulosum]|uniref:Uncharacterized protein n=1 Tax=Sorangium cellulosum TaxID=56 RepID=A0A2L0F5L8_SORCE|nr:uncharacterized protein SOCE26_083000 [Sorangium cellulosum]